MRTTTRYALVPIAAICLAFGGCGGDDDDGTDAEAESPTTTAVAETDTTPAPDDEAPDDEAPDDDSTDDTVATEPEGTAIAFAEPDATGAVAVTLDPAAWSGVFAGFNENNGDPLHQLHSEGEDTFFFNVELYTVYGDGWTGQSGVFATDCTANGICVYLDPDGTGPAAPVLADASGEVEVRSLEGGYDLTVRNLTFAGDPTYTVASVDFAV